VAGTLDYERHVFRLEKLESIVGKAIEFFGETPVCDFPPPRFLGCGVYTLYYVGEYPLYHRFAAANMRSCVEPIYVGKAVPEGRRKGRSVGSVSPTLHRRLMEHARSVDQGAHLGASDFQCRFMILEGNLTDLIVPVESGLIRRFAPLWNSAIDGFGNHDPGSGRYDQAPSEWDVLHPGRPWVERLTGDAPALAQLEQKVRDWGAQLRVP
jgi:hypothetical protein